MIQQCIYILFFIYPIFASTYTLTDADRKSCELTWEVAETEPFDELILSWNATRLEKESYSFFVSLKQNGQWSPWLFYAEWGSFGQQLCKESPENSFAETFRGVARPKSGVCDGFRIQAFSPISNTLHGLHSLFASLSKKNSQSLSSPINGEKILFESVPRYSIMQLRLSSIHEFSPAVAALSAINFLVQGTDPLEFINAVYDQDFDCYEHWPLIAVEASHRLGGDFSVHIERMADFSELYSYLKQGFPVVVGVQGTLTGAPRPFFREHGLCVIGYDPESKKVHCIDPGFVNPKFAFVSYPFDQFLKAWEKKGKIGCVFQKAEFP